MTIYQNENKKNTIKIIAQIKTLRKIYKVVYSQSKRKLTLDLRMWIKTNKN